MNKKQLDLALARFEAFREEMPPWVKENVVNEYHSIVDDLGLAIGDDLNTFKIPEHEVKPKITTVRRAAFGGGPGHANYSRDKYCETDLFRRNVEGLARYLARQGHQAEARPTNAQQMTKPGLSPTYNIGTMVGSAIQHGTRDSNAVVNFDMNGDQLRQLLAQIKEALPTLKVETGEKNQLYVDVGTIEVQLGSPKPKMSIITESMHSIRSILEGIAANAITSGLLFEIHKYFPK